MESSPLKVPHNCINKNVKLSGSYVECALITIAHSLPPLKVVHPPPP